MKHPALETQPLHGGVEAGLADGIAPQLPEYRVVHLMERREFPDPLQEVLRAGLEPVGHDIEGAGQGRDLAGTGHQNARAQVPRRIGLRGARERMQGAQQAAHLPDDDEDQHH